MSFFGLWVKGAKQMCVGGANELENGLLIGAGGRGQIRTDTNLASTWGGLLFKVWSNGSMGRNDRITSGHTKYCIVHLVDHRSPRKSRFYSLDNGSLKPEWK